MRRHQGAKPTCLPQAGLRRFKSSRRRATGRRGSRQFILSL